MGKRSISGGVEAAGDRIMFDLHVDGQRFRPTLPWLPTEGNMTRARERMMIMRAQIKAGTFSFAENFPDYRFRKRLGIPTRTYTCSEIFALFLEHCEARVKHNDLSPSTVSSYRQILEATWCPKIGQMPFLGVRYSTLVRIADALPVAKKTYNNIVSAIRVAFEYGYRDHPEQRDPAARLSCFRIRRHERPPIDTFTIEEAEHLIVRIRHEWGEAQGNYDEFRFFSGLRPGEVIALLCADFDANHGTLAITKSMARRQTRDTTKTRESRRIELCPPCNRGAEAPVGAARAYEGRRASSITSTCSSIAMVNPLPTPRTLTVVGGERLNAQASATANRIQRVTRR